MGRFAAGTVVTVRFPFSDLTHAKWRPALVLADVGRGDVVLLQITSKPYADPLAVTLAPEDFAEGALPVTSYARPGKLFTAHASLIAQAVAHLAPQAHRAVVDAIVLLLRQGS